MDDTRSRRWAGVGAVLGLTGLGLQFYLTFTNRQLPPLETVIRFFSYFTILTNTLVTAYFLVRALAPAGRLGRWVQQPEVGTALTVYILVVGVVYQTVLRGLVPVAGWGRVADDIIHGLVPLFMLGYWLGFVSDRPVRLRTVPYWLLYPARFRQPLPRQALRTVPYWLLYPAAYLAYTLLRGPGARFYPYPFVDAAVLGYPRVLLNSAVVLLVLLAFSLLLGSVANWRHRRNPLSDR